MSLLAPETLHVKDGRAVECDVLRCTGGADDGGLV
jgi:hypothetical protein